MASKVLYQTNFTGIKYNNNPLALDPNSFSTSNNVYLNKYGALISRSPINRVDYPWPAYSELEIIPVHLCIVGTYQLHNDGIIYVIYNKTTSRYQFRYKTNNNVYSQLLNSANIKSYADFSLTKYKQYYILFTVDGAKVLDTTASSPAWQSLSNLVDIPITVIQTGNEQLKLDGNQFTASHKHQFVLKPDSDDTIYTLPINETAHITVPSETVLNYSLLKANKYTRDRVLRKLNTPANNATNTLVSMVGEKIAIAHADRVDISLDYGQSFTTVVYPTVGDAKYKHTASLSEDGQCFFYVHSDGVYRYMLGTEEWLLIEVKLTLIAEPEWQTFVTINREVTGRAIDIDKSVGANYCHFVNAEKFAFMLAYQLPSNDWISVLYTKGLTITNLLNENPSIPAVGGNWLNSFDSSNNVPINTIGSSLTTWLANPYLNRKLVKILDNDTVVFYSKAATATSTGIILKAAPTKVQITVEGLTQTTVISYVAAHKYDWSGNDHLINDIVILTNDKIKLLIKTTNINTAWRDVQITMSYTESTNGCTWLITEANNLLPQEFNSIASSVIHALPDTKYLAADSLFIVDNAVVADSYVLPLSLSVTTKVVSSGPLYLIYDEVSQRWYTNIPVLTLLTYTYTSSDEFTKVPRAVFDDQYLWLAMDNTLWIAELLDNKLSALALNNNQFPTQITGIAPISSDSKAIFFADSISLCNQITLNDNSVAWQYYPLKITVGVRPRDSVINTNDGRLTIFPTKYGLAALMYQPDLATTEQAINYLSDDIKTMWIDFYNESANIKILHNNTQLILSNGTNRVLVYDFRTNGWYPQTFLTDINISRIVPILANHEILEFYSDDTAITNLTATYRWSKEADELYSYQVPYKDLATKTIPWHVTSQLLLLAAPNNYKNITKLIIDQIDSDTLKQSAYLTTQLYRQYSNIVKPSIELVFNIDTFAKISKKVNWWKVLGFKWQLANDYESSYPTQLRLYNFSIIYDISYEVK